MRISSNFKDYYDIGIAPDSDFVWLRLKTEKTIEAYPFCTLGRTVLDKRALCIHRFWYCFAVGFCGRVYLGIEIGPYEDVQSEKERRSRTRYCYTPEQCQKAVGLYGKRATQEYSGGLYPLSEAVAQYFDRTNRASDMFFGPTTPIWIARHFRDGLSCTVTMNDQLKYVDFATQFAPYQAFQELSMWLANQAHPEPPIPTIPDKTMAEIKGFNKWSFRKPPQ